MAVISSKEQDEKTLRWRRVFGSPDGRKTLEEILVGLGVFNTIAPDDVERVVLRNYGLDILYQMGVLVDKNLEKIVDKFLSIEYISDVGAKAPKEKR